MQNVEVRKGDSVRVFVELTSAYNQGNGPLPVEDNLVFTLESGVQQKVRLSAYSWDATLLHGLEVKRDTTIATEKPVVFYDDIKVAEGATLTIAPGTTLTLENSTLHNLQGPGLSVIHAAVTARNCQFTNTLGNCVGISSGRVDINQCTLAQFYPLDSKRGAAIRFANHRSQGLNLTVTNSLITGYADDVLMVDKADSIDFNYTFDHCIIRTPKPQTKDSVYFAHVIFEDPKDTVKTGEKHFVKIDTGKLRYDFRLRKISPAIGAADKATSLPTDRLGRRRDDNPYIGCYEWSE